MREIDKLIEYIKENYQDFEIKDRSRISLIDGENHEGVGVRIRSLDFSAIWLNGSYGYEENLIEIMCPVHLCYNDSVTGYLTANECIAILKNYDELKRLTKERELVIEKNKTAVDDYYERKMQELINDNNGETNKN